MRLGEPRSRPADEEALAVGDVEVGEHRQLLRALDTFGADQRTGARGEVDDGLEECGLRGLLVDPADEGAVHLEQVGADPHHPLESGVRLAHVVDGDPDAAAAQLVQAGREEADVLDGLVLGDLDLQPAQVVGQRLEQRGVAQRGRAEVHRQHGARWPRGTLLHRLQDGEHLEVIAVSELLREVEHRVDGQVGESRESGQRLVPRDEPGAEVQDGLEEDDRVARGQGVVEHDALGRRRHGQPGRR